MLMKNKLVERISGGIRYYVDPSTSSDVYFEQDTLQKLNDDGCNLAVTELSRYIRDHNDTYKPVLLTWEMTSRCNFGCPFCYIRDNSIEKEVSFAEAKPVIDYLVKNGLFEVYLSGGECLLLKDFLKIYRYFKEKGVFVTVFTNGSLINDETLTCWRKLPPSSVEITFYNDDFDSAPFKNILKLHEMGVSVLPKFTLTNTTCDYYDRVNEWMYAHGFQLNVDSTLYDGIDVLHSGIKEKYSITLAQSERYLRDKTPKKESIFGVRTALSCKSKKGIIQIAPDFSISLCNKMKVRWNLRKVSPKTALDELCSLIARYENAPLHGCKGCMHYKECSMCLVSAEKIGDKLYIPQGYCEKISEGLV